MNYLGVADRVSNYFYIKNDIVVLPRMVEDLDTYIYFPKKEVLKDRLLWEKCKVCNQVYLEREDDYAERISKYFSPVDNEVVLKFSKYLEREFDSFWHDFSRVCPNLADGVESVTIWPTRIGSPGSEYSSGLDTDKQIKIFLRQDLSADKAFGLMVLERINQTPFYRDYTWKEREAIMDFLCSQSVLARHIPNYKQFLLNIRDHELAEYKSESEAYLKSLGYSSDSLFEANGDGIYVKGEPINLREQEEKVLETLISRNKQLVTYDMLAEVMWGEAATKRFSLAAIAKTVQRVRAKVHEQGVYSNIIQTVRGKGYMLWD
jgi:hypothetical protein